MTTGKQTAREKILERLSSADTPLAVHEMNIWGSNENAVASRLSELAFEKLVTGRVRQGKRFKEWSILKDGQLEFIIKRG